MGRYTRVALLFFPALNPPEKMKESRFMRVSRLAVAFLALAAVPSFAQSTEPTGKAGAYYHYSLGHLYAELSGAYGSRGDYFDRAVDNYWKAMHADPTAGFIAEELSDFYIQSGRLRDGVNQAQDFLKKDPNDIDARRVLARIYLRLIGDREHNEIDETMVTKALEQLQKIAAADPTDLDSWVMIGQLQRASGKSPEAMAAYDKALALDPSNQDALTGKALLYADMGENDKAADLLKKVADKDPSIRTLSALADTYERMKQYALAAQTLRRAVDASPDPNPDLKRALAQDLMLSDNLDPALKIYQGLVNDDPQDVQSWLRISQIYRQQKDFKQARAAADKASEIDPSNLEVRYNNVNLLEAEGKLPEAISTLKDILSNTQKKDYSPSERANRAILLEHLGFLYRSNEQYDQAVDAFRQIGQLDTSSAPRSEAQIIDTLRAGRQYSKALEEANAAVKQFPDNQMLAEMHASALADAGHNSEAIAETKKLLGKGKDSEIYINLAQLYDKARQFENEKEALDKAEAAAKNRDDRINVHFMRGAMLEKLKKYDAAEAEFRKVLELDPDNASALNYIGYMLADRDVRLAEAKDFIQKALDRDPNNGAYLDSLGWVYFKMNKLSDAETQLRLALEHMSTDPTVHDHLGDVYFHQGKIREALTQWEASLKNFRLSAPGDQDPEEEAKVAKKVEDARVRLAKESTPQRKQP